MNLPSPEQDNSGRTKAITGRDVTDAYQEPYEDFEYQRSEGRNLPGIVEIVEVDDDEVHNILSGEGDSNDPDYEPGAARSRGNVVRKRKTAKEKDKRPRSRSRGRRTRSQAAIDKESNDLLVD